jgi:cytochrome P450
MSLLFSFNARLSGWLGSPHVLRVLSTLLRRHKPALRIGSVAFVAKHADVTQVLEQNDSFGVTEVYADKMARTTGDFILGMERTPRYAREASFIRAAVTRTDLGRVRALAGARADELIAAAKPKGQIDAVSELGRLVPLHLVETYFGVRNPDQTQMLRWLRNIFWEVFVNLSGDERVALAASADAEALNRHIEQVIAEHQRALAEGSAPDDFVTRLLRLRASEYSELSDEDLRRNIGGVIVGAVETQAKAMVHALEQLLDRPEELAQARQAIAAGDDERFARYVFEALRFNPHNPLIVRRCQKDAVVGAGTSHELSIPRGTTVYALTLSAMMDEEVFADPERFRVDRAGSGYLHFGYGQHQCFGAQLTQVVLPEVLKRLLVLPNLRVSRQTPRIQYAGPFPERYVLEFDTLK